MPILLAMLTRNRGGRGNHGGRVGAGAAGARRLGGVGARLPHARQPRLAARLPHAAQRAVRAAVARAAGARAPPGRTALAVVRAHDGVAGRVPGAAPHLVRVGAGARAQPGGVVPGVLAAAHPAPPHGGQPQPAAARLGRVAVQPRRAHLAPHV